MRLLCVFWSALVLAGLAAPPSRAAPDPGSFAIRNVRVFDGARTLDRANVVVRGGRIAAVFSGSDARIPDDLRVIDGAGQTLLPGLIDAHVHVFPTAQADALRFGVTTELDMFHTGPELAAWRAQRGSLARTVEADTWSSGIGVNAPGGHPAELTPGDPFPGLTSAAGARAFVDERVAEGADYIKLLIEDLSELGKPGGMPTLSPDEVCAVVAAAHARGKLAVVHVQANAAARLALACGADGLAHTFVDRIADPALARDMAAHHMFVISTAGVWAGSSGIDLARPLAADPHVAPYLSRRQKGSLLLASRPDWPRFYPDAIASLGVLHRAGVAILAGTDAPNPSTAHGVSLHQELANLVQAGLLPSEALRAATALPAEIFHLGDRGRIAVGARADLVLVRGDPTHDIHATLDIVTIWKNGHVVDRTPPAE